MNQLNNKETIEIENNKLENNIHDIILFILFGAFVILLLESLFKLVTKVSSNKSGPMTGEDISFLVNNSTKIK